jgi:hypothetical protein
MAARSPRRGYYALADRMGVANGEVAIFRNFNGLNLLTLLRLQSELTNLEYELERYRNEDETDDSDILISDEGDPEIRVRVREYSESFLKMSLAAEKEPNNAAQYFKLIEVQQKLREYS